MPADLSSYWNYPERSLPSDWLLISAEARDEAASFYEVCKTWPYRHFALT